MVKITKTYNGICLFDMTNAKILGINYYEGQGMIINFIDYPYIPGSIDNMVFKINQNDSAYEPFKKLVGDSIVVLVSDNGSIKEVNILEIRNIKNNIVLELIYDENYKDNSKGVLIMDQYSRNGDKNYQALYQLQKDLSQKATESYGSIANEYYKNAKVKKYTHYF